MNNAIIFDLDGTLWDTTYQTFLSYNNVLRSHNYDEVSKEKVCNNFGNNKSESIEFFFPSLPIDKADKLFDEIEMDIIKNLNSSDEYYIYDGVSKALDELSRKYELYIVSNTAHKSYIEAFINSGNYNNYFKDYIAASELSMQKYEAIIKIIRENNISNAIYVGDTNKDKIAAEKANIPFIQCLYGFDKGLNCSYKINNISELSSIIEKIFNN